MTDDGKHLDHERNDRDNDRNSDQHDSSEPDVDSAGTDGEIDDGMGANAPDDVAGEDEAVPGLDGDPLARANRS